MTLSHPKSILLLSGLSGDEQDALAAGLAACATALSD